MKSFNEKNIHIVSINFFLFILQSLSNKRWSSTEEGNHFLNEVFAHSKSSTNYPIFLIFSINTSHSFCGVAQMKSPISSSEDISWFNHKPLANFSVEWIFLKDIASRHFVKLRNQLNFSKLVIQSKDS